MIITFVSRHEVRLGHLHIFQDHCSARSRALPEARPVVDDGKSRRVAIGDGVPGAALVIERDDWNEVGEQRAGRIEFAAVHDHVVARVGEFGFEVGGPFAAELGKGVAEARPLQNLREQELLLRGIRNRADSGDDSEVILRDLANRRVSGGNDRDDLGKSHVGELGSAEGLRHVDRPQPALREGVKLRERPFPIPIPRGCALDELLGEPGRDG